MEFAVFSKEVAMGLLARGFKLKGMTNKAWIFEDSLRLQRAVEELLEAFVDKDK